MAAKGEDTAIRDSVFLFVIMWDMLEEGAICALFGDVP